MSQRLSAATWRHRAPRLTCNVSGLQLSVSSKPAFPLIVCIHKLARLGGRQLAPSLQVRALNLIAFRMAIAMS